MAIILGTRSRANIRYGPADVYIAEGGTIALPTVFGETITQAALTTLLGNFSQVGILERNPIIISDPVTIELIDSDNSELNYEVQHRTQVRVELKVAELDNTIANALIARAEQSEKTDFLWLRTQDAGDYINFIRNVPFTYLFEKNHDWEDIERMIIRVFARVTEIKTVHGQWQIVET